MAACALLAVMCVWTVSAPAPVAAAQPEICTKPNPVLVNGSFESPSLANDGANTVPAGTAGLGWQLSGPSIDLYRATTPNDSASEGINYAEVPGGGFIYQDIASVPGETLRWRVSYRTATSDALTVEVSAPDGANTTSTVVPATPNWTVTAQSSTDPGYVVPPGQTTTRLLLRVPAGGGHFVDDVRFVRPATACDDAITTTTPNAVRVDVLANDMGSQLEITGVSSVSPPNIGNIVAFNPGSLDLVFGVNTGSSGVATFTYDVQDEFGNSATGTVTVTVLPSAVDDFATVESANPTTVRVLANDQGTGLTVKAITAGPSHGTARIVPDGIEYTSDPNYSGGDTLTYELGGPGVPPGAVVTATVTLAVTSTAAACAAPNVRPANGGFELATGTFPSADPQFLWQGTALGVASWQVFPSGSTVGKNPQAVGNASEGRNFLELDSGNSDVVLYQDIATQGGELVYWSFDTAGVTGGLLLFAIGPPGTTATDFSGYNGIPMGWTNHAGSYQVPPGLKSIRVQFEVPQLYSDVNGVYLDNVQVGTVTVACDDSGTTLATQPFTGAVLANDQGAGVSLDSVGAVQPAGAGTLSTTSGTVTFTPAADFNGSGRAFSGVATVPYTVVDIRGGSSAGNLVVEVVPVPQDDTASTLVDQTVTIPVLANDLGTGIGVGQISAPAHGEVAINGGNIDYSPDPGFRGTDTFTYDLSGSATDPAQTATVTVTVSGEADLELSLEPPTPTDAPSTGVFTVPFLMRNLVSSPLDALEPKLTFTLPAGVTLVGGDDCSPEQAGPPAVPATCERFGEDLVRGGAFLFSPQFVSTVTGPVTIQATASALTPDDNPTNNTASATVDIIPGANIAVTGAITPAPLLPGATGNARILVTNNGPSDASGSQLVVALGPGMTPGPTLPPDCTLTDPTTITCDLPNLVDGASVTIDLPLVIDPTFTGTATLNATVTPPSGVAVVGSAELVLEQEVKAPEPPSETTTTTTTTTGVPPTGVPPTGVPPTGVPPTGGTTVPSTGTTAPAGSSGSGIGSATAVPVATRSESGTTAAVQSGGAPLAGTGLDAGRSTALALALMLIGLVLLAVPRLRLRWAAHRR